MRNDKQYYEQILDRIREKDLFINNTELAYQVILQEILKGELVSGDKILQETLAAMFDMSRTPVRDALIRLENDGYIEKSERNGYQVKRTSLKEYVDFCEFRILLETKAAYLAARNITTEDLDAIRENIEAFEAASEKGDVHRLITLDNEFHMIVAKASNNTYIYETVQNYRTKNLYHMQMTELDNHTRAVLNKHRDIYEALCKSDEKGARKAMKSHLQFFLKNVYHLY